MRDAFAMSSTARLVAQPIADVYHQPLYENDIADYITQLASLQEEGNKRLHACLGLDIILLLQHVISSGRRVKLLICIII